MDGCELFSPKLSGKKIKPRRGLFLLKDSGWQKLPYVEVDGLAVFQGDMVLGKADQVHKVTQYFGETPPDPAVIPAEIESFISLVGERWPDYTVPVLFDPALLHPEKVVQGIQMLYDNTPLYFVVRTTEPNYIYVIPSTGNWSYVGMQGGLQQLGLQSDGNFNPGIVAHEFSHALGVLHEQSRYDRDDWVEIEWDHIIEETKHNFEIPPWGNAEDIDVYDYFSIMHYGPKAFSADGEITIVTLDPDFQEIIGQREYLSDEDIEGIEAMYPPGTE
jgi:hypothetical protein